MLGYIADKALAYGVIWSVSQCLSLCLGCMATDPCTQNIESINIYEYTLKKKITGNIIFYRHWVWYGNLEISELYVKRI